MGRVHESEPLFLEYLQCDKDLSDYDKKKIVLLAHNYLRLIYKKQGNKHAHEYHLRKTIESFELLSFRDKLR